MFSETFAAELATRIGSQVEVTTDNNMVEGILSEVTADFVLVLDVSSGYGDNVKMYLSLEAINFIRFPAAAA